MISQERAEQTEAALRELCQRDWPDPIEFAAFEAPMIYLNYVKFWGALGVLDYEWTAGMLMQVEGNRVPWLWQGVKAHCGDEVHTKAVARLKEIVAAEAKRRTT